MTDARIILGIDDPAATPSRRLTAIAEQLAGKLIAGVFDGAPRSEINELAVLSTNLFVIARDIDRMMTLAMDGGR